jgi:hypothetical protein
MGSLRLKPQQINLKNQIINKYLTPLPPKSLYTVTELIVIENQ